MKLDDNQAGLRWLCRLVRAGALLGAVAAVTVPPGLWADPGLAGAVGATMGGLGCEHLTVDTRARWLGAAVSLVPATLGLAFFGLLWRLFGEYAAGRALTAPAQRHLQRLAGVLLAMALVQPLLRAAYSVVLTMGNPPGQRHLVVSLSSDDYIGTIVGLALLAIATVMRQAVAAADENRGFV